MIAVAIVWTGLGWWFRREARPRHRTPFVVWMMAGGLLAGLALVRGRDWPVSVMSALSLAAAAFGLFAASRPRRPGVVALEQGIRVGETAPGFVAVDENGHAVDGASLYGAPLLLKFFRGHW